MPFVKDIHYFSHNENIANLPPVVFIHGAGGNHLYWPPEIRRMPKQRTYALDLPGHGKSSGVGRQSIDDYVQDLRDFFSEVGISKAVVVGHSMGGAIALAFALRFPRRALGLVLVGSGARLRVSTDLLEMIENLSAFPVAADKIIEMSFSSSAPERLKKIALERMLETRPTVLHGDFMACNSFDLTDKLARLKLPTLALCGREDKMTPPRYSEYLAENIENARLQLVEDAGHMLMLERPNLVAGALSEFLAQIAYRPGE